MSDYMEGYPLTQAIFKGAPSWVMSASVSSWGSGRWHKNTKDNLAIIETSFNNVHHGCLDCMGTLPTNVNGFNTEDWRNSAINRIRD